MIERTGGPGTIVAVTLPLISDRLELRPYRIENLPRIHELLYGNEQATHMTGGVSSLQATRAEIEVYVRGGDVRFYVLDLA